MAAPDGAGRDAHAGGAETATTAHEHGPGWSAFADDYDRWWADLGAPTWDVVLDVAGVTVDTRVLDVGCGPGRFLRRAADRGAAVSGIDAAERMVALARAQVPAGDLRVGAMERLPWASGSFELVTALNAIQFAADPADPVAEMARVVVAGGRIGVCVWGPREDRHVLAVDRAVAALVPDGEDEVADEPAADHPTVADWSRPGVVEGLLDDAGLTTVDARLVDAPLVLPDHRTLLAAFLADVGHSVAAEVAGRDAVRAAIEEAAAPYRRPDGTYRFPNTFRLVIARA